MDSDTSSLLETHGANASVRPQEVTTAIILLWTSLAVGIVNSALQWPYLRLLGSTGFILAVQVVTGAVFAWLIYKISVGRNWARITFVVAFVVGFIAFPGQVKAAILHSGFSGVIMLAQTLFQVIALYLIFLSPGRHWFGARVPLSPNNALEQTRDA
jgi:hypothetical protein